jgi:hypothetical protein
VAPIEIAPTPKNLNDIDFELSKTSNEISASRRKTAVALSLNFNYDKCNEAKTSDNKVLAKRRVNGCEFVDYLLQQGIQSSAMVLYEAVAAVAMQSVSDFYPMLSVRGWGVGLSERRQNGLIEDENGSSSFEVDRIELRSRSSTRPFLLSLAFLENVVRAKSVRNHAGSYWIKHIAEHYSYRFPCGESLGPMNVPNGVLIAAAIYAGFDFKTHKNGSGDELRNVTFNISRSSLIQLEKDLNPAASCWRYTGV